MGWIKLPDSLNGGVKTGMFEPFLVIYAPNELVGDCEACTVVLR